MGFRRDYERILELFGKYQNEVLLANTYRVSCAKGCGVCCYHWAEDVYSFEVKGIVDYLKKNHPDRLKAISARLKKDVDWMHKLTTAVRTASAARRGDVDPYDIALSAFYQLKRPCPLLGKDGACGIYPLRPLTCRIYVSFSDKRQCLPQNIQSNKTMTYLLDLEKDVMELFDMLHFMYDECDGDVGLRSMLLKLLSKSDCT
jgi:Fe-S-cluster containining protein